MFFRSALGFRVIAPGGCALPAVEAGGMPSRNMRILLPVPAAGHPWPALGIPPPPRRARTSCAVLDEGNVDADVATGRIVTGSNGTATPGRPLRSRARPLLIFDPKQENATARPAHRGVCGEPAMDGRRPAAESRTRRRPAQ